MSEKMPSENVGSKKGRDVTQPGRTERVSDIERVGGKGEHSHSFNIPNHPDMSVVRGPGGKMDK